MGYIPKAQVKRQEKIPVNNISVKNTQKILFSFEAIDKTEYFNLDGTCQNWAADLFDTMQKVSGLTIKDIHSGKYSGKNSTLRIHPHGNVKPPCKVPENVALEDMWQIRISLSKGGIHGIFYDNIFYVIWFDPHHNLYPSKNHGGLKKIKPPSTCCKDRDLEIDRLQSECEKLEKECEFWQKYAQDNQDSMC